MSCFDLRVYIFAHLEFYTNESKRTKRKVHMESNELELRFQARTHQLA